ncbi:hypothetical protein GCM10007424_16090 [Flavobacterium suaedae]|uniref:Ig-like domain-containing protein n=1 Tax=Flavobacterium suaedae TaxID=1767027 RepID=A0ABQ1JUI5_9FLAO|nr:hypothetical protein [Flavobacterium suaedae]GGB76840.1 hypothetical protein GCM10007424_16090 [Flavobacterium suaedae]
MKQNKHFLLILLVLVGYSAFAQVKIGDNPTTVGESSLLELESTNKALVLPRVTSTDAITTPVEGMILYDLSSGCVKVYENGAWSNCLSAASNSLSDTSNGTAIVASYSCSGASVGTMTEGEEVSGTTQTITANVTAAGSYNISATYDGVTFSKSGIFNAEGDQDIVLEATGTPNTAGEGTYTLNTTPNCSFTRSIGEPFNTTACTTTYGNNYPATVTVDGQSVTVTKSGTSSGTSSTITHCGVSSSSGFQNTDLNQFATYTFTVPLKNVQVYSVNNEESESQEGYTVSASLNGAAVPVQLVVAGGTCQDRFSTSQAGNEASIRNTVSAGFIGGIIFNISSASAYDEITITRLSTASGSNAHALAFCNAEAVPDNSSGGSAIIASYDCESGTATGTLTVGTAASGVTQTITVDVTAVGGYNISTSEVNGITWSASGTFSSTGEQAITLTASGTPTNAEVSTFTVGSSPSCTFNRTIGAAYTTATCGTSEIYGGNNFPITVSIDGTDVNVTRTGNSTTTTNNSTYCGNISGNGTWQSTATNAFATYTFDVPLNNVQVIGIGNENTEGDEGYTISASLDGVSVPVLAVGIAGNCLDSFDFTQDGNEASARNSGIASGGLILNISSTNAYDTITITRTADSGGSNRHALIFCNAEVVSN